MKLHIIIFTFKIFIKKKIISSPFETFRPERPNHVNPNTQRLQFLTQKHPSTAQKPILSTPHVCISRPKFKIACLRWGVGKPIFQRSVYFSQARHCTSAAPATHECSTSFLLLIRARKTGSAGFCCLERNRASKLLLSTSTVVAWRNFHDKRRINTCRL